jgi:hypothetical protein
MSNPGQGATALPEAVRKAYAEEWKRQIINAGGDENIAQQAVALAALNGLFDNIAHSPVRSAAVSVPIEMTDDMIEAVRSAIAADAHALYRSEPDSIRIFYAAAIRAALNSGGGK